MASGWVKSLQCKSRAFEDVYHPKPKNLIHNASCRSSVQSIKDVVDTTKYKPRKPKAIPTPTKQHSAKESKHVPTSAKHETSTPPNRSRSSSMSSRTMRPPDPFFPSLNELPEGHPSRNVVEIIFHTSWGTKPFTGCIEMIFKVQNGLKTISRFEEYREMVKTRAGSGCPEDGDSWEENTRCVADGNEVMRFHCLGPSYGGGQYFAGGINTLPSERKNQELYAKIPQKLRETMEAYCSEQKELAFKLLSNLAKALNMDSRELEETFDDGIQRMRFNYYPPCPEPQKVIGFTSHSDASGLTILFQLDDTDGLQIRKEGKWVPVKPLPNAFIVNVGDILEIVSNGVYKSIEHRATVNSIKERVSVATFNSSGLKSEIGPAPSLVGPQNPAIFRTVPTEKYFKNFFANKLNGKSNLEYMRIR